MVELRHLQDLMKVHYGRKDETRGDERTCLWLVSEVGELADAIRREDTENIEEEIADVLAWLLSLANVVNVDVQDAVMKKYGERCPRCDRSPCTCTEPSPMKRKPHS
jgi:NTP pyrophosphatase (non-canonical NTP hydrolase)